jgi:small subunit ribosomal protein S18
MARDKKKSQAADRRRPIKKKVSILSSENIDWVDYKDVNLLRRFMSERAKIRARRVTGNSAQQQRAVARAIRIAREMALLPYSVRQVTQRGRGGRRDRDRDRGPEPAPESEGAQTVGGAPDAAEAGDTDTGAQALSEVEPQAEAAPSENGETES